MQARYYDPSLGRFVSEDPGRNGENWYSYCGGDPIDNVDQTGKYGKNVTRVLNDITDQTAEALAIIFTLASLQAAMMNKAQADAGIAACAMADGILAVVCWAVALGGNADAAMMTASGAGISVIVGQILSSAPLTMDVGANALAAAAVGATAAYGLELTGALVADDC